MAAEERFADWAMVVGIADKMREAWVLNGFVPATTAERTLLSRLKAELGLDPVADAHRLRALGESEPRNPKRMLTVLTGGDREREAACWKDPPLAELRQRGGSTGLAEFLDSLRDRLLPLIG
jgi:hypothetical protein